MKLIKKIKNLINFYITFSQRGAKISKSREIGASESREMDGQNQKALTKNQDSLTRRPVELSHTPSNGAIQVSVDDQNRLVSASSYLRNENGIIFQIKNNTFNNEDAVFGFTNGNMAPTDTRYKQYSSSQNHVKSPVDNPHQENSEPTTSKIIINDSIAFFNSQNNQGAGNDQQRAKDIKNSHSVSDIIHNNYLDNVKLKIQQNTERSNPEITKSQFVEPPITGSMSIEAKNTCPISRNISDKVSILTDENDIRSNYNSEQQVVNTSKIIIKCPYCSSGEFVKRGTRQKKRERVQLYICKTCGRTFTPFSLKGKHYPLNIILDAISYYNLGFSLEQVSKILASRSRNCQSVERQGTKSQGNKGAGDQISISEQCLNWDVQPSTIANWYDEHKEICAYNRMRPFAVKEFSPYEVIETATLAHRQLYHFRYHRAKIKYIMEDDFKHYKFHPLKEFLDNVSGECPHQYFQEGLRASESPIKFSKEEMIVRNKENFATRIAKMILEGVKENKLRHESLQKFMIANDSVTVATEVPVYIRKEDLEHMQTQLGFKVYRPAAEVAPGVERRSQKGQREATKGKGNVGSETLVALAPEELPRLITGHIDFLQIRNGSVHILDYKSDAAKERPIEQLTLYALALSRLTGLRVFHFKCAWFDEKDYFEFFPLHAVYKPRRGRKKVYTKEGEYDINNNAGKMENLRPKKLYK